MANVRKVPYYTMERSIFRGKVWKEYLGSVGAVPINTSQTLSFDRLAPGASAPPTPPKLSKQQLKAQQAEEARQKAFDEYQKKQQSPQSKQPEPPKPEIPEAEDKEKLPEFDIQDIPSAMENFGWPISAKIAKTWFARPKHIWDNDTNSVQPIEDSIVTLDWVLKYGNVQNRFNELFIKDIYSEKALSLIKGKVLLHVTKAFTETQNSKPNLDLDTTPYRTDLRQFHIDWQFQQKRISTQDTLEGTLMTDLSGALANFFLYAAIGKAEVTGERYFNYKTNPHQYCIDAVAQLTHVYIYVKDNYSFNDKDPANSQYLGHWNKRDMILSYLVAANDLLGQYKPEWKSKKLNSGKKIEETTFNWDYLINRKEVNKPVDKRTGMVRKFMEKDVYWPVYNSSYNEWREKHNRGGDFMIYSKPKLYKLEKPIAIKLETICRPYASTVINQ